MLKVIRTSFTKKLEFYSASYRFKMKLSHYLPGRQVLFSSCVLWKSQTDIPFPSGPSDGFGSAQLAKGLWADPKPQELCLHQHFGKVACQEGSC